MSSPDTNPDFKALWQSRAPAESWLSATQRSALDSFAGNGFPTKRLEDWKYTDVSEVAEQYPNWLATQPATAKQSLPLLDLANPIHLAFVDGRYSPEQSTTRELPAGIFAGNLADAPPKLQERFGRLASVGDSGFVALNTAFANDGFALLLEKDTVLEQPVYLSFYTATAQMTTQPRLLIDLGPNSHATVIEHYAGSAPGITNAVTEINCATGATLNWNKLQDEHKEGWHLAAQYAELAADARLQTTQADIGAALTRNELRVKLAGSGAHAEARGLLMADARRHVDSRITVEHAAPHTTSRERFRSILADRARGVFNGRILVQQAAQKTSADLTNRNLLLSAGAEINTKPELEIYADDVKCAHGSTTGQLDEIALFYLLSRGIDHAEARNMLIIAFVSELLTDIGIPALTASVQAALQQLGKDNAGG